MATRELVRLMQTTRPVHLIEMLMSIELMAAPDAEAAEKPQAKWRRPGKDAW